MVGCLLVGVGGVLGQVEGLSDKFLLGVQVLVQGGLPSLDGGQLAGDAGLFGFEGLQGDGVGVVGLEEFFSLALQSAAVAHLQANSRPAIGVDDPQASPRRLDDLDVRAY